MDVEAEPEVKTEVRDQSLQALLVDACIDDNVKAIRALVQRAVDSERPMPRSERRRCVRAAPR